MVALDLKDLSKRFDGVRAIDHVSAQFRRGSITILLGPNGAGKTTLFDLISGHLRPDSGRILLSKHDITGLPPHITASQGVGRLFQEPRPFNTLSVLDNLVVAVPKQRGERLAAGFAHPQIVRVMQRVHQARARSILATTGLAQHEDSVAGTLSYGQQKLLCLLRLIMAEPSVLLLDEPTSGVYGETALQIAGILRRLGGEGRCVVIIEHDITNLLAIADEVVLMVGGKFVAIQLAHLALSDRLISEFVEGTVRSSLKVQDD